MNYSVYREERSSLGILGCQMCFGSYGCLASALSKSTSNRQKLPHLFKSPRAVGAQSQSARNHFFEDFSLLDECLNFVFRVRSRLKEDPALVFHL